jgi:hypothetical protein
MSLCASAHQVRLLLLAAPQQASAALFQAFTLGVARVCHGMWRLSSDGMFPVTAA